MKVRIDKSKKNDMWYASCIGLVYEVEPVEYNGFRGFEYGDHNDWWRSLDNPKNYILKSDCTIIPEDDLIAFSWSDYETGNYDVVPTVPHSNRIDEILKTKDGYIVSIDHTKGVALVSLPQALQLRPKVVSYEHAVYNPTTHKHDMLLFSYTPSGKFIKAEIIES